VTKPAIIQGTISIGMPIVTRIGSVQTEIRKEHNHFVTLLLREPSPSATIVPFLRFARQALQA
jgi:hypothetical protein